MILRRTAFRFCAVERINTISSSERMNYNFDVVLIELSDATWGIGDYLTIRDLVSLMFV